MVYKHFVPTARCVGWVEGTRTLTGRSHSAVLCQLSYDPHRRATRNEPDETFREMWVTFSIRPKLAGMTRLELANQLIENQSAFHFAFIPVAVPVQWPIADLCLSGRLASNRQLEIGNRDVCGARGEIRTHHKASLKPAASSNWATRARKIRILKFALVPAEGFEPTLSSF